MKWGLVLSGGAAHGLANAGVIQCLHENGLRPDYVAGSSMGAIVAAVYACGYPPSVFREILGQVAVTNLAKISENAFKGGFHSGLLRQRLGEHLQPYLGDATIGECQIPFICVAGQIQQPIEWKNILRRGFTEQALSAVRSWVFPPETPLLQAVLASSAIPVVFSPVEIAGYEYIDMIHFGAIPARTLRERCVPDVVIATDTDPRFEQLEKRLPQALRQFLQAGHHEVATSLAHCDLVIKPTMPASPLRFDRGLEFVEAGHLATQNQLAEIRQLLEQG